MKRLTATLLIIFATSISFSRDARKTNVTVARVKIDYGLVRDQERCHDAAMLTWEDFQGLPDTMSQWGALTHSGIRLRYEYRRTGDSNEAMVKIAPYMDRTKSWCKPMAMNDYTLAHEQRHFDIAALVTSELATDITRTNYRYSDFSYTIVKLHEKYMKRLAEMQELYDEETAHGDNYRKQQEWNQRLATELAHISLAATE